MGAEKTRPTPGLDRGPTPGINHQLSGLIRACTSCRLHQLRNGIAVPAEVGVTYHPGGIALLGEAPGQHEDRTGRPFVGPAGMALERALAQAGITRDVLLIMNRVRCRPPGNRLADYPDALNTCHQWTEKELAEYDPAIVVLMGTTAIRLVFGETASASRLQGQMRATGSGPLGQRLWIATYHPAHATPGRTPGAFPMIVRALELAKEEILADL